MPNTLPHACYPPPLTDEMLAGYRDLIAALEDGPVKEAMAGCFAAVQKWWSMPESKIANGPTFRLAHRRDGESDRVEREYRLVPLEPAQVKELWDSVPWDHEHAATGELFMGVEKDAYEANMAKAEAWQAAVWDHIKQSLFPKEVADGSLGAMVRLVKLVEEQTELKVLLLPAQVEDLEAKRQLLDKARDLHLTAINQRTYGPIEYPKLQPTLVRDAAWHLWWHVQELVCDREPMTLDKL